LDGDGRMVICSHLVWQAAAPALNSRTTSMHRAMFRSGQTPAQKWFQEDIAGAQLCLQVFRRNRPLSALTLICPVTYSGDDTGKLAGFSASTSLRKIQYRLYLHENNKQTPKPLFSFLYNGFRGSRFIRMCRLRRHFPKPPITLAPDSRARGSSQPCRLPRHGS
jgi:hypothetical protein